MGETKRIKHGVDILHAEAIDEHIGSGVIADRDHHGGEIAQSNASDAGCEAAHDIAVGDQIGGLHGV